MGDTLRFAERINLAAMEPHGDQSSTGYALADPGKEYLVLDRGELDPSDKGATFTVALPAGIYAVEWHNVKSRETARAENLVVKNATTASFTAPFRVSGAAVLYLKKKAQ